MSPAAPRNRSWDLRRVLRWSLGVAAVLLTAGVALEALARPGGGHTFSGGSFGGGGGGGGGGGDGAIFEIILYLVIRYPKVGIPVAIVAGVVWVVRSRKEAKEPDWSTSLPLPAVVLSPRASLQRLRKDDPDFSTVLFEDFVYALYARAHEARGGQRLDTLAPWLGPGARGALTALGQVSEVKGVVVGALRIAGVTGLEAGSDRVVVRVGFESNYTEVTAAGEQTWYVVEQWHLMRKRSARSRPPERSRTFDCPSCGAALGGHSGSICAYCNAKIDGGELDWAVGAINLFKREARGPQLTSEVQERGTGRPTLRQPGLDAGLGQLAARPAGFDRDRFLGRVDEVFQSLQVAWSTLEWSRARPYVSDALFQTQLYWIEAYRRAGLRNVLENPRITQTELVAVSSDRWYDALTVRVYAESLDYTIRAADGERISGSNKQPRAYSEYWTFVRGTDAQAEKPRSAATCPNCGAPLRIAMTGNCEYCEARVTSGEFGWVLSRIEQDEAYTG